MVQPGLDKYLPAKTPRSIKENLKEATRRKLKQVNKECHAIQQKRGPV